MEVNPLQEPLLVRRATQRRQSLNGGPPMWFTRSLTIFERIVRVTLQKIFSFK
jgi:hypothetical protein